MIKTKRIYDPPEREDGTRILVMRYWPRGITKSRVHEWQKELSPSKELIADFKGGAILWSQFRRRYLQEMKSQKEALAALQKRAKKETLTLLCSCEDEKRCHRALLKELLMQ